jgi:outer membrane protein assembly factor BamB
MISYSRPALVIFGVSLASLLTAVSLRADNWPGWRGPGGDGVTTEKNLPVRWSTSENVIWNTPLEGNGVSTPVVWGDHIFLTASDGRLNDHLHVFCYQRKDGKQLWHVPLFGTAPTNLYAPGGMAVPTPVTDGNYLYCLFGTGDLVCLDFAGRPVWIRSLAQEYGEFQNRWGMASSPVLIDDLLVVLVDHWGQSYLLGVDARTGKNRWKANRDAHVNWTSPVVIEINGKKEIVTVGTEKVHGYDAAGGKLLWTVSGIYEQCVASPVVSGNVVLVGSSLGSLAIRPDGKTGDLTSSHVVWKNKRIKANVPTQLSYQGLLYTTGDSDFVTCQDIKTGEQVWKSRVGGQFHASPVGGDGKVYFASKDGVVTVIKAGRTFEVLSRNDMGEMIVASPAVSNGQIFLRGEKHLFCIGSGDQK